MDGSRYLSLRLGQPMTHFSDPEKPKDDDMKKLRMDQAWRKGLIGDPTYLRSLFIMGYLPKDANTELNLLKLERKTYVRN
jgi:hypothetical protein